VPVSTIEIVFIADIGHPGLPVVVGERDHVGSIAGGDGGHGLERAGVDGGQPPEARLVAKSQRPSRENAGRGCVIARVHGAMTWKESPSTTVTEFELSLRRRRATVAPLRLLHLHIGAAATRPSKKDDKVLRAWAPPDFGWKAPPTLVQEPGESRAVR